MNQEKNWLPLNQLREPFNDAVNYQSRTQREFFQKIFLHTESLQKILDPQIYFLMGEKGSGKTAYATYLETHKVNGHRCKLTTMTETQYRRFVELKRQGKLAYSDYANIWRSMLLFIAGRMLVEKSKTPLHILTGKFSKIEKEIQKWAKNALNPEVETAFEAISAESLNAKIKPGNFGEMGGELKNQITEKTPTLRHHLLETENSFKDAIHSLTLADDHILFIDGIDYRPNSISYTDYIECVKGLGEAVWQLNTEFFGKIRDTKGRVKVVLLVRPDVFHELNLYNSNSRLQDNCVFLDWSTTEKEYKESQLYELSGRYFSAQQSFKTTASEAWEHYFFTPQSAGYTFKRLLKLSFHKPRDILTYIKITKKHSTRGKSGTQINFNEDISTNPAVSREFSDYLLGEVRNYAAFYMHGEDFQKYIKFFQFLDGQQRFNFDQFSTAFHNFKNWANGEKFDATTYLRDPESLLQFLYDVNVIGYSETIENDGDVYYHWSYRERSANNIAPQVKTTGTLTVNPGISKALDIGKRFVTQNGSGARIREKHQGHRANKQRRRKG